jgi:hypothetical protein
MQESRANLKSRPTAIASFFGFLMAASLIGPPRLRAQAGPGPIAPPQSQGGQSSAQAPQPVAKPKPQLPARKTIGGPWKLNVDDSDDPRQRARAADGGSNNRNNGNYPGGGYPGGGYPGGGYPGGGYPGGGYPGGGYPGGGYPGGGGGGGRRNSGQDIEDNAKMEPLLRRPDSLTIELKNSSGGAVTNEVDVTDNDFHKLILFTDGRQLPKATDENNLQVAAHWNGSQLVSDEKSPLGGNMSRTFELSADGRQLYETLHIDNGKSKTPLVIRYVYNVSTEDMQTGEDNDPDRPVLKRHSDDSGTPPQ